MRYLEKVKEGFIQMTNGYLPNKEAFSFIVLMTLPIIPITYII